MRYCCNKMLVKGTIIYRNQSAKKKQKMVSIQKTFLLISLLCTIAIVDTGCQKKSGCPANSQEQMDKPKKHGKAKQGLFPEKFAKQKGLRGR